MNVEIFSALSRNVGKLREMKKAHEDMATEIALLRLENSETHSQFEICQYFRLLYRVFCLLTELSAFPTDALSEAKAALADTGNAQVLRTENQELYKMNRQLKIDIESTRKLLEAAQKAAREQAEKDAESIRLLQDNLEARLVETKAVDDDLPSKQTSYSTCHSRLDASAPNPASFPGQIIKDSPTNENRRSLIGELGELIMNFRTAGCHFVTRLFPDRDAEQVQLEEIPVLMWEMASKQAECLPSVVRGRARTCLALMVAHYRTANRRRLACLLAISRIRTAISSS